MRDDAGTQHRTLSHTARPVKDRQTRGAQIGDDLLAIGFSTEEKWRVTLFVWHEPDIGRIEVCDLAGIFIHDEPPAGAIRSSRSLNSVR